MKIKVGEYIRTKSGKIEKIKSITNFPDEDIHIYTEKGLIFLRPREIVKHSPNIIDLIEVGDYVNGFKVLDIAQAPKKALYLEDISQKSALIPRLEEDIETIVTHEQFKEMEYEV